MKDESKRFVKLQFGAKSKSIIFVVSKASGSGVLIYDFNKKLLYTGDEGMLAGTVHEAGEELRLFIEKLLSEIQPNPNGDSKPLIVSIAVNDSVPSFGGIAAFSGMPSFGQPTGMHPLAGLMFSLGTAFGISPNFPVNKEGFIQLSTEIANKLPESGDIVDIWPRMLPNMGFNPGFNFGSFEAASSDKQSARRFGNAANTTETEDEEGVIHLK